MSTSLARPTQRQRRQESTSARKRSLKTTRKVPLSRKVPLRKTASGKQRGSEATPRHEVLKLRGLTAHLLAVQESERRRISSEIHDDLLQRLGVLEIQLEAMKLEPPSQDGRSPDLESLRVSVAGLTEDLHRICCGLHPVLLDTLGLGPAIEFLCEDSARLRGVPVKFVRRSVPAVPPNVSLCLYRVVQEALHNVAKHARAKHASVILSAAAGEIRLVIQDDGCGFVAARSAMNPGLGLICLRERVRLVSGYCEIQSNRGQGTRIVVCVPLVEVPASFHSPTDAFFPLGS